MYHLATCFWVSDCTHSTGFVGCAEIQEVTNRTTLTDGASGAAVFSVCIHQEE